MVLYVAAQIFKENANEIWRRQQQTEKETGFCRL